MFRWFDYKMRNIKIWKPCNIYPSAKIGDNVSIGRFTEIGNNVSIGRYTRVGAMSFIPEGVSIGHNVFIGPHVVFTNDKFPPSGKGKWLKTKVENFARIGAGVTIVCGVTIGKGSLVGAGSVVTKNIPQGETWAGVPAKKLGVQNGN